MSTSLRIRRPHGRGSVRLLALAAIALAALGPHLLSAVLASPPPPRAARLLGTSLLYPPATPTLRFSHAKHAQMDLDCEQCHAEAKTSTQASDNLRPPKKACAGCHDVTPPENLGQPGVKVDRKACGKCHTKLDPRGVPAKSVWPKPRVRFPHKLHLQRKVACKVCHAGVEKSGYGGKTHLPSMAKCFECHDGKPGSPASRCVTCHVRTAGGRLRTRFPEGALKPGPSLPHLEHGPTFERNHKVAARAHREDCEACHERSTCLRCHGGIRKPASIHLGNYILRHGREARANRQKCNACHTRQRFCVSCHQRSGVARSNTRSPYRVPGIRKFHGPNWASSGSRGAAYNRHATHARRNVSTCVSCHRERDCMRCHARRRVGGFGANPHGPGFRRSRRCKILLRKNRRACLKCHGFNDPLMSLCR
jgi:hypothetical protein